MNNSNNGNNSIVSSSCTLEQPLLGNNEVEELSIVEIRRNDDVDVGETLLNNDELRLLLLPPPLLLLVSSCRKIRIWYTNNCWVVHNIQSSFFVNYSISSRSCIR